MKYIFNLKYVKLLSYKSARYLQTTRGESHKHRYLYYYGFQAIYGALNKGLLLILLGSLLGILHEVLFVTLSFMALRIWSGGLHFDDYTKCAYVSLGSLLTMGILSKYIYLNNITIIIIFSTISLIILLYSPISHKNRTYKNNERLKFKIIALIVLVSMYSYIFITDVKIWSNSIVYGTLLAGLIASPILNNINMSKSRSKRRFV